MIADTTFLVHLVREDRANRTGPARAFLARNRREVIRTSIISLAEVAVMWQASDEAWAHFRNWKIYRCTAALLTRLLMWIGS